MDFQAKKLAGFFFIDIPSGKIFTKILRMDVLMIDKTTENITFLFGFCTVEGIQFLLADQKPGDTFSQPGIFLHIIGISGDPDDSDDLVIVIDGKIDPLLCAGEMVIFTDFDHTAACSSFPSDLMKGSYSAFICACKNCPGTIYKINVLSAEIPDGIYDLLCKGSGDIRRHLRSSWSIGKAAVSRAALRTFFAEYIFWSASINKPIGNIITNPGTKYQFLYTKNPLVREKTLL